MADEPLVVGSCLPFRMKHTSSRMQAWPTRTKDSLNDPYCVPWCLSSSEVYNKGLFFGWKEWLCRCWRGRSVIGEETYLYAVRQLTSDLGGGRLPALTG